MRKKVTLSSIAHELGVSPATVSRALNNKGRISQTVRNKVIEKARERGYLPGLNGFSSALRKKVKRLIAIFPENDFFWREVERGMYLAVTLVQRVGVEVEIQRTDGHDLGKQIELLENLLQRNDFEGLAFVPADFTQLDYYINALFLKEVTVSTFNIDAPLSKRLFFVGQNIYQSGKVAGELLSKLVRNRSSRKILVLASNKKAPSHVGRWQGLIDYVHEHRLPLDVSEVFEAADDEQAYELVREVIPGGKYSGIFVTTAFGNAGVGRALQEVGKYGLAVVGNDIAEEWIPYLREGILDACLFQEPFLQGYLSIKLLAEYLVYGFKPRDVLIYLPIVPVINECLTGQTNSIGELLIEKLSVGIGREHHAVSTARTGA